MSIYFVSDFHLGDGDQAREAVKVELFSQFLQKHREDMDHLVILGDMFDFWFEYKHLVPKENLHLLFKLNELVARGVEVTYLTGNHDLWMGDFLEAQLGIRVERERLVLESANGKVLIMHGDGLAKSDWRYRILKRVLRCKINIALYRLLPPALAYSLAHAASRRSRRHSRVRPQETFLSEYHDYARERFREGYFAFVCGHTHHPEITRFDANVYVNSGDWIDNFSYVRYDGENFELLYMRES